MDRTGWIAVIVCTLVLLFWFQKSSKDAAERRAFNERERAAELERSGVEEPSIDPAEQKPEITKPKPEIETPVEPLVAEETAVLKSGEVEFHLTSHGGGVAEARLLNHRTDGDDGVPIRLNEDGIAPIGALSEAIGETSTDAYALVEQDELSVVFERTTAAGLKVRKTWSLADAELPGAPYRVVLKVELENAAETGNYQKDDLGLFAGQLAPLNRREYDNVKGFVYRFDGNSEFFHVGKFAEGKILGFRTRTGREYLAESLPDLQLFALINQFYTHSIQPRAPAPARIWGERFEVEFDDGKSPSRRGDWGPRGAIGLPKISLAPGESTAFEYDIYLGPKEFQTLKKMGEGVDEIMRYGDLPIFGWVARPFSKLLNTGLVKIHGIVGSWGLAIILLTCVIRILIWPLHMKAQRAMKRMGKLGPMMTELREKYADDPQKMNAETMKLYREYGVNPFGGCWPMLIQMPIFLGFFQMLRSAVELRHEGFLFWVHDLAQPDTVAHILGLPINPLPIAMGVTMFYQMRMTPQTGDKTQQKIFMFMPLIFLVICYGFASALALYWTTSNIISILQGFITKRQAEPELKKRKPKPKRSLQMPGQPETKKPKKRPPRTGGSGKRSRK